MRGLRSPGPSRSKCLRSPKPRVKALHEGAPPREAPAGPAPTDRGSSQPWRPGTPPLTPADPDLPGADIRIGYARCSTLGQELDSQLDALAAHSIPREKAFSKKTSTRIRARPQFEAALAAALAIKARPVLSGHPHRLRDEAPRARRVIPRDLDGREPGDSIPCGWTSRRSRWWSGEALAA
ncbi:recombinase family protein [Streptomyces sp. NPDC056500]|uniref:recombinase family protein n=1 Tax=Streptomyces sp. NPDC056500 TaxID=3345840 RepID=UPI0036B9A0F3